MLCICQRGLWPPLTGLISERAAWHGTAVTILESATLNRVLVYPTQDMSEETRQLILSYFARRVERTRHGWDRRERSRISARLTKLLISSPHVAADSQITFERVYCLWLGRINNFPPLPDCSDAVSACTRIHARECQGAIDAHW